MMKELIDSFFALVGKGKIEIYNEFRLQHEFGIFLREHIPGRKIQFERNVAYFGLNRSDFVKKEIDVCVFGESSRDCAIELSAQETDNIQKQCIVSARTFDF